ncbi:hypothetical protein N5P13_07010 [Acinetobacter baylyi]|nr:MULTISPECIES: hypothetical protein [Acinetobacter]MAK28967.1 hypothetical protein [Acinetobacter sp.]UXJ56545.1 hypothetical protein N5P16_11765 [Acinetobacter baylyi]UXJ61956.1 hypothetical protein N5P13_07010 [Acinetobacter baylyi]
MRKIYTHVGFLNNLVRYSKANAKYFIIYYQYLN